MLLLPFFTMFTLVIISFCFYMVYLNLTIKQNTEKYSFRGRYGYAAMKDNRGNFTHIPPIYFGLTDYGVKNVKG